jgi:hypothetical protein
MTTERRCSLCAVLVVGLVVLGACGGTEPVEEQRGANGTGLPEVAPSIAPTAPKPAKDACLDTVCCHVWGRCTTDPKTQDCVVGSDQDCLQSIFCGNAGFCTRTWTEFGYRCYPGSPDDCLQAYVCTHWGQCTYSKRDGCVEGHVVHADELEDLGRRGAKAAVEPDTE